MNVFPLPLGLTDFTAYQLLKVNSLHMDYSFPLPLGLTDFTAYQLLKANSLHVDYCVAAGLPLHGTIFSMCVAGRITCL